MNGSLGPRRHRVALMQPYFLPYLGYWQLLADVDEFVVYDTAQFVRGSWINRNRIQLGDQVRWLTLPMEHAHHRLPINQRLLARDDGWRGHLLRQVDAAYRGAPHRDVGLDLLEEVLGNPERELGAFLAHSVRAVARRLGVATRVRRASSLSLDPTRRRHQRVLDVCRAVGATEYLNLSGGRSLYDPEAFREAGIALRFQVVPPLADEPETRRDRTLSILDVVMRRERHHVARMLADSAWTSSGGEPPDEALETRSRTP